MSGHWDSSNRRSRLPANWAALQRATLERAGYRCEQLVSNPTNSRLERCTATATDADHIHPGDDHSAGNLQALCHDHHQQKTQAEAQAAAAAQQAKLHHPSTRRKPPGLL